LPYKKITNLQGFGNALRFCRTKKLQTFKVLETLYGFAVQKSYKPSRFWKRFTVLPYKKVTNLEGFGNALRFCRTKKLQTLKVLETLKVLPYKKVTNLEGFGNALRFCRTKKLQTLKVLETLYGFAVQKSYKPSRFWKP